MHTSGNASALLHCMQRPENSQSCFHNPSAKVVPNARPTLPIHEEEPSNSITAIHVSPTSTNINPQNAKLFRRTLLAVQYHSCRTTTPSCHHAPTTSGVSTIVGAVVPLVSSSPSLCFRGNTCLALTSWYWPELTSNASPFPHSLLLSSSSFSSSSSSSSTFPGPAPTISLILLNFSAACLCCASTHPKHNPGTLILTQFPPPIGSSSARSGAQCCGNGIGNIVGMRSGCVW